jgi:hypothetical protein
MRYPELFCANRLSPSSYTSGCSRYGSSRTFAHLTPTAMLNSLRIQNFKSWQDTGTIQFGAITGFFGTNSSGKTSILQFLLMLKQTVESSDRAQVLNLGDERSYVELGTMYDIIHNHTDPGKLAFSVEWTDPNVFWNLRRHIEDDFWESSTNSFDSTISRLRDIIEVDNLRFRRGNQVMEIYKSGITEDLEAEYTFLSKGFNKVKQSPINASYIKPFKFYGIPTVYAQDMPEPKEYTGLLYDFENFFGRIYGRVLSM